MFFAFVKGNCGNFFADGRLFAAGSTLPLACFTAPIPPPALAECYSRRHLLSLPRGRGPSQTPKFLSPGPPSPWLPALLIGKGFCHFCGEPRAPLCARHLLDGLYKRRTGSARGCKGRSPLHEITLVSPFPVGEGGRGDRGQGSKLKAGQGGDKEGKPPRRVQ